MIGYYDLPIIPLGPDWDWVDVIAAYIDAFGAPIPAWLYDLGMAELTESVLYR